MDGILLIDKPAGLTSHDVVSRFRRILKTRRIGHAGTLDPEATGLLVLCVGRATRVSQFLLNDEKRYQVGFRLGIETNTYDLSGEVIFEKPVSVKEEKIHPILKGFVGEQEQVPPLFSAIKVQGKKLYEYARSKMEVEIPIRRISIYSLELKHFQEKDGCFEVHCSKGTYVRSLVHDIGQKLGTGAVATEIRRIQSGSFTIERALPLEKWLQTSSIDEFIEKNVVKISDALSHFSKVSISKEVLPKVLNGSSFEVQNNHLKIKEKILILQEGEDALALGEVEETKDGAQKVKVTRLL